MARQPQSLGVQTEKVGSASMFVCGAPKQRWFQFHLITALVMTLFGSAWIGLNCNYGRCSTLTVAEERLFLGDSPWRDVADADLPSGRNGISYGIPWPFLHTTVTPDGWWSVKPQAQRFVNDLAGEHGLDFEREPAWRLSAWPLILDLAFALAVLGVVACVCERIVRRRRSVEGQRPPLPDQKPPPPAPMTPDQ